MRRTGLLWLGGLLACLGAARDGFDDWVDRTEVAPHAIQHSVEVLDREGRLLRAYTVENGLWRLPVRLDQVDPLYLEMLVAYEDKAYWDHPGVDLWSLTRAVGLAVRYGRLVSGGSTLTMQVARLLEDGTTGELGGKLRQMRVAWALERRLTKEEILTLYLNLAPFGGNLEGLRSATFAYFGKEPNRLTPAQAAMLVALPQAPSSRRPDRSPARALAGRDRVLRKTQAAGVLSAETARAAQGADIPKHRTNFPTLAAHLSDRLRRDAPLVNRHQTSLDRNLQAALERLTKATVETMGPALSAAIVVADHRTGAIVAHVGAASYTSDLRHGWVDMSAAKRSPGSTLKPLIYGMGFDLGLIAPGTVMQDRPMTFSGYSPGNFDGLFRGPVRAEDALKQSLNVPAIALTEAIGPARVMARLRRAGTDPRLQGDALPGLAIALGGLGLTLEELVTLYGAIARGGPGAELTWTGGTRPAPNGTILSPQGAATLTRILAESPPPTHGARRDLAYKTGTSYGHRDAWAIGFNGRYVAGVWVGRADSTAVPGLSGAEHAAPLLFEAMQRVDPEATPFGPLPLPLVELPPHLRHFGTGGTETDARRDAPDLTFPQDGTRITVTDVLALKVRKGTPPFTWLINDAPVAIGARRRSITVEGIAPGPTRIAVIDASGRVDAADVILER